MNELKHPIITHQAFTRINDDSQWVYCKWSDGTYTRYRSTSRINSGGQFVFDMGPSEKVNNPPELDWKSTGRAEQSIPPNN